MDRAGLGVAAPPFVGRRVGHRLVAQHAGVDRTGRYHRKRAITVDRRGTLLGVSAEQRDLLVGRSVEGDNRCCDRLVDEGSELVPHAAVLPAAAAVGLENQRAGHRPVAQGETAAAATAVTILAPVSTGIPAAAATGGALAGIARAAGGSSSPASPAAAPEGARDSSSAIAAKPAAAGPRNPGCGPIGLGESSTAARKEGRASAADVGTSAPGRAVVSPTTARGGPVFTRACVHPVGGCERGQ